MANQQASSLSLSRIDKLLQKSIWNRSMCSGTTRSPVNNLSSLSMRRLAMIHVLRLSFLPQLGGTGPVWYSFQLSQVCLSVTYSQCFPCKPKKILTSFKMQVRHNFMKPCRFIREVKGKGQTLQHGNKHPLICNSGTRAHALTQRFFKTAIPHRTAKKYLGRKSCLN